MRIHHSLALSAAALLLPAHPAMANGWLGLTIHPPQGVQVGEIFKEGPADRSGLRKGDLIRSVDDTNIRSPDHFTDLITQAPAGKSITLTVWRKGEELKIKATLDNGDEHLPFPQTTGNRWQQAAPGSLMPPPIPREKGEWSAPLLPHEERFRPPGPSAWLGIAPGIAAGGVAILDVAPRSPAEQADLKTGDVIIAINRQAIASPDALVQTLGMMRPGDLVEIAFNRDGRTLMSQVQLQKAPTNP
ncbi:MAG: PDZ domain-containing protein [Magnetococcus sp. XQGC-1]